jgi:hypothetical protein
MLGFRFTEGAGMKVKDIIHENGKFWVLEAKGVFYVMVASVAGSNSESAYGSPDLAIARCDYLARRAEAKR